MKENKDLQPFFSKFLENQMDTSEQNAAKGSGPRTLKWPSDKDEAE